MSYFFIINPKAGKKHRDIQALIANMAKSKNAVHKAVFTKGRNHATELAAEAVKEGYKNIIAVGGDGTIQETAKGLLGSNVNFGLLPCGSGNGLARNLNIPLDVEVSLQGIFDWTAKPVDIGFANDKLFLVSCGLGLDAEVAHSFNSMTKRRGIMPYVWHAMRIYFAYKPVNVKAVIDGKDTVINSMITTALIGRQYGGGAIIAPKAVFNDGMLDLCVVKKVSTVKLLFCLPSLFFGNLDKYTSIYSDTLCKTINFDYGKPFWYHLDGEDFFSDAGILNVRIQPGGINIIYK